MQPRRVGNWVLERFLGEGGYGKVELGVQSETNAKAALKFIFHANLGNEVARQNVQQEINTMRMLDHENVLKLHEYAPDVEYTNQRGQTSRAIMLVIELASKGELFHFLSYTGAFEEPVARSYFHQLMNGLEHCHQRHVVHRDLKPENLLLNEAYQIKIADFGFSAIADEGRRFQTQCGTKSYQAPEVLSRNRQYAGQPSDIFACGIILFIMLAGFPPFKKATAQDWWYARILERNTALFWEAHCRNVRFSNDAKDLINRMLEPNPEQRITIEGIRVHPWFTGHVYGAQSLASLFEARFRLMEQKQQEERANLRSQAARVNEAASVAAGQVTRSNVQVPSVQLLPSVVCYTTFETALHPTYVLDVIKQTVLQVYSGQMVHHLCDDVQCKQVFEVVSEDEDKIRCEVSIYNTDDFTDANAPIYLVRFSRLMGDTFEFQKLFQDLKAIVNGEPAPSHSVSSVELSSSGANPFHFGQPAVEASN